MMSILYCQLCSQRITVTLDHPYDSRFCSKECNDWWEANKVAIRRIKVIQDSELDRYRRAECLCNGVGCNSCEPQGRG